MRIARLVLGQGYMPVAVTTSDTKNGCWSLHTDLIRIPTRSVGLQATKALSTKIYILPQGVDLEELLINGLGQGALVMVSSLNDELVPFYFIYYV